MIRLGVAMGARMVNGVVFVGKGDCWAELLKWGVGLSAAFPTFRLCVVIPACTLFIRLSDKTDCKKTFALSGLTKVAMHILLPPLAHMVLPSQRPPA